MISSFFSTGVPTEKPAAASAAAGDSTATSDALLRIEEILFRNEQLVESLKDTRPVAPKRGRVDAKLGREKTISKKYLFKPEHVIINPISVDMNTDISRFFFMIFFRIGHS